MRKLTVIIGASGIGKTWLCRQVMDIPTEQRLGWIGCARNPVVKGGVRYISEVTGNIELEKHDDKRVLVEEAIDTGKEHVFTEVNWAFRGWFTWLRKYAKEENMDIILLEEPKETFTRNILSKAQATRGTMTKEQKIDFYHGKTQPAMLRFFKRENIEHKIMSIAEAKDYLTTKFDGIQ